MINEIKSVRDVWKKMPSEHHARRFLEEMIWQGNRYCPHCGSLSSVELKGSSTRSGLYQCREAECRKQFTITTKTPLHGTKLDLRIWIAAIFLILTSSKGISSVVMSRILGVNQTSWKLGHAVRELVDDRDGRLPLLSATVEVDEVYVGGAPKFRRGRKNKRGRGTSKPMVLVAAARDRQARACLVPNGRGATLAPPIREWIDTSAVLMTDKNRAYNRVGREFAGHFRVNHGQRQYSIPQLGIHINSAEAVSAQIERALVGVYHRLGSRHLQRCLDEVLWRWNHREPEGKVRARRGRSGRASTRTTVIWKPIPVIEQMRHLLRDAVGRQVRRSSNYGLCWP